MTAQRITDIFTALGTPLAQTSGLAVTSPQDGGTIAQLAQDYAASVSEKITRAATAQQRWSAKRSERQSLLETFAAALKTKRELLAEIIHLEAGKTLKEAQGEADSAIDVIAKTIEGSTLADLGNMTRVKERPPVGVVGLITSFNFPIAVAHWTLAPALLAGNAVVWKPSEKTPLTALAVKAIFDSAVQQKDLLHIVIGARDVGEALVAHEKVDMVSATGSVVMGQGIKKTLTAKKNNAVKPILELGGNNGVIISQKNTPEQLAFAVDSLMNSFLGTSGQRCTNTRRLIVHAAVYGQVAGLIKQRIEKFLSDHVGHATVDSANAYGYGPLIDADAFSRFEQAKKAVMEEGGQVAFGKRLFSERAARGFFVEPALATLPAQSDIMHRETFAPILFMAPYHDAIEQAIALVNAPDNAGLVAGIYTQSQQEADSFAALAQAGHVLINSPKGTGTPAHGMGFGGNKHSGEGEILNTADPLQAFTRPGHFTRIAHNKDVAMNQ